MLLTAPLLSKSSFLGSLFNKFRQVTKTEPIKSNHNNKLKNKNLIPKSTSTPITITSTTTTSSIASTIPNATGAGTNKINVNHNGNGNLMKTNNSSAAVANISTSSQILAATGRSLEEQVGLPPRPKKPLTPYFRYMKEMRTKVLTEHPNVSNIDVVRQLSKQWLAADASIKQRLQDEYKRDQQQYLERRTKYDAKISDEQRAEIKQLKQEQLEEKERKLLRKRIKELGRPKKPASAFILFIAKERTITPQTAKQTYREWHQKATAKWARLSDSEKEVFLRESRTEMEKYKKEISVWEEKMIRLGHVDVVRNANLIDPPEPKAKKH